MKIFGFEIGRRAARVQGDAAPSAPAFARPRQGARAFEAGASDRLVQSWTRTDLTVNQSLYRDLKTMRARSRDFFRNNEYGRKFASLVRTNVVGPSGFSLKVDCRRPDGTPDKQDSDRVRAAYLRWTRAGNFEVTGRMTETQFDALAIVMIARDGEVLIRKVEGSDRGPHGCQLQLLPGHLLDEEMNRDLANGNRIRMGVEFDAWMKPVAYHLRLTSKSDDLHGATSQRYERVPAEQIIHLFVAEEIEQWRGVPWAYAALRRARQLDQFDEAALVAANVGASKMGFFQQKDPEAGAPMGTDDGGDSAEGPDFITEATPGEFGIIPDGYEFKDWSPEYPTATYDPFVKAIARALATGCLVSYHGLTGDLTQVNFSSIRAGTLDEREMWKQVQSFYIDSCKRPVFEWWLGRALVYDQDLRALPYAKFEKFNAPVFSGRRWEWIDPKSDVQAAREAVALGIDSRAQIIRNRGRDPDEVWDELAAEEARGFTVAPAGQQPAAAQPQPAN